MYIYKFKTNIQIPCSKRKKWNERSKKRKKRERERNNGIRE